MTFLYLSFEHSFFQMIFLYLELAGNTFDYRVQYKLNAFDELIRMISPKSKSSD